MTRASWKVKQGIVSHNSLYMGIQGLCRLEYLHEGQELLEAADPNIAGRVLLCSSRPPTCLSRAKPKIATTECTVSTLLLGCSLQPRTYLLRVSAIRTSITLGYQFSKGAMMEREPNLISSGMSRRIVEGGINFKVDIYQLEGGDGWTLEVVLEDGTSIVWDDLFDDDQTAFEEAVATIRNEGAVAFANGGSNVVPFKR